MQLAGLEANATQLSSAEALLLQLLNGASDGSRFLCSEAALDEIALFEAHLSQLECGEAGITHFCAREAALHKLFRLHKPAKPRLLCSEARLA